MPPPPHHEPSLADRAAARWFSEQVQPHEPALREWLSARFPWLSDIDNLTREAMIRLWHKSRADDSAAIKSPKALLFAIARNAAYDEARRRAIAPIISIAEIDRLSVLDEQANVAEHASLSQEIELLGDALRDLPDGCRQVLTLCKMYGYTPAEVAQTLGISEHTVRAQIAKGIRRCAAFLRHRGVNRDRP